MFPTPPRARRLAAAAFATLVAAGLAAGPAPATAVSGDRAGQYEPFDGGPLVLGHRGASGYRPEHTLASYKLAARMGADYIEPDLVSTKDHILVARHENEISGTTNVADKPEFADRRKTKTIDKTTLTGWFTEDFTLAELKTLRAKERIPEFRQRNVLYNGRYEIPTFQEVIDLQKELSEALGRDIGIIPETKHPTYFRSIGLPLDGPLVRALRKNEIDGPSDNVIVQSFEVRNLKRLDRRIDVPLVQLLDDPEVQPYDFVVSGDDRNYADLATPEGLEAIAEYADGVGPFKNYIVPKDAAGNWLEPTSFVDDAHDAGLFVTPYTFRNENNYLPAALKLGADPAGFGNAFGEYAKFYALGVDGVFSDHPDTAVEAREEFLAD